MKHARTHQNTHHNSPLDWWGDLKSGFSCRKRHRLLFFHWSSGSLQPPFFFDLHVLSVFSLWISGSVFLCSLFIYRYFLYFLSLFLLSVSLVKGKLDPESLGIILLGPFLLEFFPDQVCVCACVCVCVCVCAEVNFCLKQTHAHNVTNASQQLKHMDKIVIYTHTCCPADANVLFPKNMWCAVWANQRFLCQKTFLRCLMWNICVRVFTRSLEWALKTPFYEEDKRGRDRGELC